MRIRSAGTREAAAYGWTEHFTFDNVAAPPGLDPQVGEMNQPNLVRVLDGSPMGIGTNRLVFGKDGSLYVGKTALSWTGGKGITRIKWNGKPVAYLEKIKATPRGFALNFSQPLDASTLRNLSVKRHTYQHHEDYGAPKKN